MDDKKEKPSWYSLHKEQVKLIQFLLYHLRKGKEKPVQDDKTIKIIKGEIVVSFD
jgi:hypothetical protein